ncbi:hypothetical protein RQP50_27435 [Paenibacillus sp. chi10]|uniref:Uncharacterized protein n=1 Tax=Paenibacillus suaedae TaxID=3077233 RepID=A0AAJ2K0Z2_9BACL|nr:hypothetical protein [Paenibacillus sp. chi10]MDT8979967.1 hypothetical protein [Paenibacillus sp. chi10]
MYAIYKEANNQVEYLFFNPTPEQKTKPGIEIEGVFPTPDAIPGMVPVLKVDVGKVRLYYDYERPDTIESRVHELQKENTELKLALAELAELVAGGAKENG